MKMHSCFTPQAAKDKKYWPLPALKKVGLAALCLLLPALLFSQADSLIKTTADIRTGADRMEQWLPALEGKRVAIVANQTSVIAGVHLVDTLLSRGVVIKKVFAPEHGFRGAADAGEHVKNSVDTKTGLPVVSLYGDSKKPSETVLSDVDVLIFDIQDVGARFYTYISSMHYVMEACAEQGKTLVVLDRPNPHGFYVDGPILNSRYESFVGLHPVPVVHGMTIAEYAQMINGQGWLANAVKCSLVVVTCENYTHNDRYQLPIRPSPNLPNMSAIYLYPSLCFFEGTVVSIGRGTDKPFQVYGHPDIEGAPYAFTPISMPGAKSPVLRGQECVGYDLSEIGITMMRNHGKLHLGWLQQAYQAYPKKEKFFISNGFFNLLAGNSILKQQIIDGLTEDQIRESWQPNLIEYKTMRKQYLLYPDFE